jgi:dynein heavy chain 1, cytosolic
VKSVLSSSSTETSAILQSLTSAGTMMAGASIFDLSPSGTASFSQTLASYESSIDEIENNLSSLLHTKLSSATSAEEMFKHFAKFNPLFVRPRIRSAIKHYQTELIKNVSNSVSSIQKKVRIGKKRKRAPLLCFGL